MVGDGVGFQENARGASGCGRLQPGRHPTQYVAKRRGIRDEKNTIQVLGSPRKERERERDRREQA